MRALLVCSSGGHLIQLHNLKPWWERHDRLWVTFEKLDSTSLLAGEQVAWAYHPTTRNLANLADHDVYAATTYMFSRTPKSSSIVLMRRAADW